MIGFLKRLGRAAIGTGLFLVALAAIAYWYVSRGPVDLAILTPRLQAAITRAVPGLTVKFGSLSASRDAFRSVVVIRAEHVVLQHAFLAGPAEVAEMVLVVPQTALMGNDPTPREVILRGVQTRLAWTPAKVRHWLASGDSHVPPRLKWLDGLDRVEIKDVDLDLVETSGALPAKTNRDLLVLTQLTAERGLLLNKRDIHLRINASLVESGGPARLAVRGKGKAIPNGQWEAELTTTTEAPQRYIRAFAPTADMPTRLPRLAATTRLSATDQLQGETVLSLSPGQLVWAPYYAAPLAVQSAKAQFRWRDSSSLIELGRLNLRVNDVMLTLAGTVHADKLARSRLAGGFKTLSMAQLKMLWPAGAAEGGRSWVVRNMEKGGFRDGAVTMMPATGNGSDPLVTFTFKFDGLTAHYRDPMPPLTNADGVGTLTNQGLTLDVSRGFINAVTIPKARVFVGPFPDPVQHADVDLDLAGNLPQLLAILDSEPLGFISRYGLKPETVSGAATGNLKLKIPLLKSVALDDIAMSATAQTKAARVPDIYAGKPLESADLGFVIARDRLTATGTGYLNGNPLAITWSENFTGTLVSPTRYEVSTRTSASALAALGIDLTSVLLGNFPASLVLEGKGAAIASGTFTADATNAQFTVMPFGIVKPAGIAGKVAGHFFQQDRLVLFDQIQVTSAPVSAQMTARIPIDAGRTDVAVSSFIYGSNNFHGTLSYAEKAPLIIALAGGELDLRPELAAWRKAQTSKEKVILKRNVTASALPLPGAPELATQVTGKLDRIRLLNNIDYGPVTLEARLAGDLLTDASIKGRLGDKAVSQITISSQSGMRKLQMTSDDSGLLAQALDLYANARGGKLSVDADFSGHDKALAINGKATIKDVRLINAPALAKTLTIASLTGLSDTLRGRGIEFRSVDAPFTLKRGIIDIRKASAVGPGLGVTLEGQMSRTTGQTNMRGTIVPSYGLNAAIGKIPLVGRLIVGGKDQGLIGFNYRITGTAADFKIDVTKSSGLAPGFLRQLFRGKAAVIDPAYEDAATRSVPLDIQPALAALAGSCRDDDHAMALLAIGYLDLAVDTVLQGQPVLRIADPHIVDGHGIVWRYRFARF